MKGTPLHMAPFIGSMIYAICLTYSMAGRERIVGGSWVKNESRVLPHDTIVSWGSTLPLTEILTKTTAP